MTSDSSFGKDAGEEALLSRLNAALGQVEEETYEDLPDRYPTLHVVGVPRAGTTLATQVLAAHLDVGYINQLVAAFWNAPAVGIRLSRKLLPETRPESFSSEFGRTRGIAEPHEFGYFWRNLLGYEDLADYGDDFAATIDWKRVRRVLTNMTWAFGRVTLFKSFLFAMHIPQVLQCLPRTCFVRITRDPVDNALSLLKMREQFMGSSSSWASVKPREYLWLKHESVPVQVAGQVTYLERMLDRGIRSVAGKNVLEVRYDELCGDPERVVDDVRALLAGNGADVDRLGGSIRKFVCQRPSLDAPAGLVSTVRDAFAGLEEIERSRAGQ